MKLVELLARELIEWPEGAKNITQDKDGGVSPCTDPHNDLAFNGRQWTSTSGFHIGIDIIPGCGLSSDYATAIITRAQWQAERDRQKGGEWKRHRGGKCPVSENSVIDVKLDTGDTMKNEVAGNWEWSHQDIYPRIMQYRVISQPQAEEVEYRGPFLAAPIADSETALEYDIEFPSGVCSVDAKTDQMETPFKWRDEVTELNAYIEKYTRERDALIERLASEGFALIPPVVSVVSEFSGAGMIFPIEEWQIGDIVQVVSVSDESVAPLGVFKITDIDASEPKYELDKQYFPNHNQMKFIRRP